MGLETTKTAEEITAITEAVMQSVEKTPNEMQSLSEADRKKVTDQIQEKLTRNLNSTEAQRARYLLETNFGLSVMEQRLAAVQALPPESPGKTTEIFNNITTFASDTFGYIKDMFAEAFKPKNMKRVLWTLCSSPEFLGLGGVPFIGNFVDKAKQNLAILDIEDAMDDSNARGTFTFDGKISLSDWMKYKQMKVKDESLNIPVLTATYIETMQLPRITLTPEASQITLGKILEPKKADDIIKAQAIEAKKKPVLENASWKDVGVTSVEFGTETKFVNGALSIAESEVDTEGKPIAGSNAEKLRTMKKELTHAKSVILAKTDNDRITINIKDSERSVTLPFDGGGVKPETLNDLVNLHAQPFKTIVIEDNDATSANHIRGVLENNFRTIYVRKEDATLAAIAGANLTSVEMNEGSQVFQWTGTTFTPET